MKNIKNIHIEAQKNSPSKGGFSDIRIRFFVLSCMVIILVLAPFLGILYSSVAVMLFALFLAEKRSRFELCDLECTYHHYQEMDKLYGWSEDAEYCKRQVETYQLMYGNKKKSVAKTNADQSEEKETERTAYSNNLNLALNR